ncbi:MAG TPA: hypothetical protein VHZ01_03180 [Casimicrobiaceae bacterium]|nr:hypothetical protein [Casimicrobiaceae bacterium]
MRQLLLGEEQGDVVRGRPRLILRRFLRASFASDPRESFAQIGVSARCVSERRVENGLHGHSQSALQRRKRYTMRSMTAVGVCLIFFPASMRWL